MNTRLYNFSEISQRIRLAGQGAATGTFRDYSIASAFQPIFSVAHRSPVGYEGLCRAQSVEGRPVPADVLFRQVRGEAEHVLLDRLCRAIHVQNFCSFPDDKSWIFLNVDPLITVVGKNYGPFFKDLLQHHRLAPDRVVIEILEQDIHDESVLSAAVDYYKELGCLVALDDFGASRSNFDRLWRIQPDIVKFDRSIVVRAEASPIVRKALPSLVSLVQETGCIALMEGVETEQQALIAMAADADLIQGYYLGYPGKTLEAPHEGQERLSRLSEKFAERAAAGKKQYRQMVDSCVGTFGHALAAISRGAAAPEPACGVLLSLPGVRRIYFLDELGRQVGRMIYADAKQGLRNSRNQLLTEAGEANWSGHRYFRQAIMNPGKIQISRPHRSLTGQQRCITLSAQVDSGRGKWVVCADIDWAGNDILA